MNDQLVPVTRAEIKLTFNNNGLKKMFPGTKVNKKKLKIGEIDPKFLASSIKSSDLRFTYTNFEVIDLDLEGFYDNWELVIKLKVY
jgi:ABC-type metal ion transport system substrate-binding protein